MINFFRKTRKKLADDNKPLKYARYAIGEIVLVVIGILIALQINNANENRLLNKVRQNYYNQLIIDSNGALTPDDQYNIIKIYDNSSKAVKDAFDGDTTNDIDSWDFSDWIKIVLPIVKAIEKYNLSDKTGEYKKTVAIIVAKCVIVNELTLSEENRKLLIDAIDSYLKPSIDIIVFMINSSDSKKRCLCF